MGRDNVWLVFLSNIFGERSQYWDEKTASRVRKTQAETRRTGGKQIRTEPNRNDDFSKITGPKRVEPSRFLPGLPRLADAGSRGAMPASPADVRRLLGLLTLVLSRSDDRKTDSIHHHHLHHHHHPEGVVYRSLCLNSSTVSVSEIASMRLWCIESLPR